ncbi:signal peptidase II [Coraliomargarita sp. SDUM461004]|uniref:Lipoprotein signal peptidase n=1 Tax=Thalassobacterium sedimentorum TaxID=3041258 RepID=A0ABU1AMC3_9BACT|nr:signal peptidase II [Coraliomargarita sp. SDUM461004]MDQ8195363.1 signal peptidase II [Coraliomargarita sp. SDUM461004]
MPNHTLSKLNRYRLLYVSAIIIFVLDQITKTWIFNNLPLDSYYPPESITVIEGFFYIVHIGNEGAAWGMFSGYGGLLALFALITLFAIYKLRHSLELHRKPMQWAFGLLIGGILGNMIDRLIHGHVIDFLDFHFPINIPWIMPTGRYPSFNIADCGIVIGTIIYLILSFKSESAKQAADEEHPQS